MIHNFLSSKINFNNYSKKYIRSFVLRHRKLNNKQNEILNKYWIIMGLEYQVNPIDIFTLFHRNTITILEIGFGIGSSLIEMAKKNPQKNFLGIEVYLPGIISCLKNANIAKLKNLRLIYYDAIEVLQNMILDNSLDTIQIFFPDPWPKLRHNKRRIIQYSFLKLIIQKLKINGIFHMATDCESYAKHTLKIINKIPNFYNMSNQNNYILNINIRPTTKFELRGKNIGNNIFDLMFKKI
ncbi:tRNA (guanine-N(7)-)-methyltransferase [Serratia symbiotica]|nr:tRNA (guanine-N(7)-)-methyltransferase [Serratia symbiotica]